MWKKQGSWNFFHAKLIPNSSIDYATNRELERNQMERLATLDFVNKGQNLFVTASSGTGKIFLACALGHEACIRGFRTFHANIITSQYPASNWYDMAGDPTIADAMLDRIIHTAHTIELRQFGIRKYPKKLVISLFFVIL